MLKVIKKQYEVNICINLYNYVYFIFYHDIIIDSFVVCINLMSNIVHIFSHIQYCNWH